MLLVCMPLLYYLSLSFAINYLEKWGEKREQFSHYGTIIRILYLLLTGKMVTFNEHP